jgi:hypothetical protein
MGHPGAAVKAQRPAGSVHGHTRLRGARERWAFAAYAPGGFGGTVGLGGPTPGQGGGGGCAPGASWERWAARPHPGKDLREGLRPVCFVETVGLRSPRPRQGGRWGCAPRGPLASPGSPHGVKRSIHSRRQDPPRSQKRPLPTLRAGPAGLDTWSSNRISRPSHPETICAQTNGRDGAVRAPRVPSRRDGQGALLRSSRCSASRPDAC